MTFSRMLKGSENGPVRGPYSQNGKDVALAVVTAILVLLGFTHFGIEGRK